MEKKKNKKTVAFDFDKTLTLKDTNLDFFKFAGKKQKLFELRFSIFFLFKVLRRMRLISNTYLKNLGILLFLKNYSREEYISVARDFARVIQLNHKVKEILHEYRSEKHHVIIITASLSDYVRPLFPNIEIIGSEIDFSNGKLKLKKHCYKEYKIECLKNAGTKKIDVLYTDSLSDIPLVKISSKIYLVTKHKLIPCSSEKEFIKTKKNIKNV